MKERGKMSQQQRLVQLSLVGTILLSLLIGVYFFASRRFSKRGPARKIVKHTVDKHPDDALKYWTADKMRGAQPAPMPNVEVHKHGEQH
jgi:hypothetical protein